MYIYIYMYIFIYIYIYRYIYIYIYIHIRHRASHDVVWCDPRVSVKFVSLSISSMILMVLISFSASNLYRPSIPILNDFNDVKSLL